jgi:lipopolysaccharide/colanic/teichoic acid biosynthesis glycosyltransferase
MLSARTAARARLRRPRPTGESRTYLAVRRLADILAAILGLAALAPLLVVAVVVIMLDSPGRPFYCQQRIGRYGRPFRLVKLRTMGPDAEADGCAVWARDRDPRVTRVGLFMRRSRFDEIPQLWNVLVGDMSLIGPRPERPEFVALLSSEVPLYGARHVIRPGLTGWAQVQYKYGASVKDAAVKLEYDLYYIRHRSLALDAGILLKTLWVVLQFKGT